MNEARKGQISLKSWWLEVDDFRRATGTAAYNAVRVTAEAEAMICRLRDEGFSYQKISERSGIPRATVADVIARRLREVHPSPFYQLVDY